MPLTYEKPPLPAGAKVNNLVSSDLHAQELTPKTRVVIINRGRTDYKDKFDAHDYVVPPGLGEVEYEVAHHFRERAVVPGSRDPLSGNQEVFIAILGIDPPELCEPFTDEECARYGMAVEAIDRSALDTAADRDVKVITTSAARARTAGKTRRADITATDPTAMEPPVGGDAALAGRGEPTEE